ncbi:hypothetical protein BKA65DRAFT_555863 [Rhexocercosporidium sp. MPI-PUGE-AT-0058]|nr:hypothetical protein BKA65DRAFT_555863 [Rhexocercosporidium sp. MPI-PUGE-AT-0058]
MLSAYNSILANVRGKLPFQGGSQATGAQFFLFSSLPPELRIKIWSFALPSRIIEASLKYDEESWRCHVSRSSLNHPSCLQVSTLFSVNVESREVCLSSYIRFCGIYIHRSLDVLYISWQQSQPGSTIQHRSDSVPMEGQPLSQLHTVAISLGRNNEYDDNRFGALVSCLRNFGTPRRLLLLCLVGPNLPNLFSDITGFSISSGKNVVLLDWPNKVEEHMGQSVTKHVMEALEAEKANTPGFKIPNVDGRLRYITVSNPSRHVLRDRLPF